MPLLCCSTAEDDVAVGGRDAPPEAADASPPVKNKDEGNSVASERDVSPQEADAPAAMNEKDERALAESEFFDARQSLTASMVYPPATSIFKKSVKFSLDEKPQQLLKSHAVQSSVVVQRDLQEQPIPTQPGYPGSLTQKELEACLEFRRLIKEKREEEPVYYEMVHCFDGFVDEAFSICRFMRARQFVVQDALELMEGNLEKWKAAKKENFYPNMEETMGCPMSLLHRELPMIPWGLAMNGSIVTYFQVGNISLEALDCITDLENFVFFFWNVFTHAFKGSAAKVQEEYPDTTILSESTVVIDLKGISRSIFSDRVMAVLKEVIGVLQCFPESLSKLIITNAPFYFSAIWMVLKRFLDPRTVQKVDIYASDAKGKVCIAKHIDKKALISDYGGEGLSFQEILHEWRQKGTIRELVERIFLAPNGNGKCEFELASNEKATVLVFTRSVSGSQFTVSNNENDTKHETFVKPDDGDTSNQPYSKEVASEILGPGRFTVAANSTSSEKENFLVVIRVYAA